VDTFDKENSATLYVKNEQAGGCFLHGYSCIVQSRNSMDKDHGMDHALTKEGKRKEPEGKGSRILVKRVGWEDTALIIIA
jgi:hypothetical protein